jgi:uncharacterized protein
MFITNWLIATWEIIAVTAPWLLFGLLFAGIIHVLLPTKVIERHLQKPGIKSVLKASLFGIPLPLCSCSVIPVGVSLKKSGASKGATASFMVSTPEIGVDSFLVSYALLGPYLAITRVVSSFLSALSVGALIDNIKDNDKSVKSINHTQPCCQHEIKQTQHTSLGTRILSAIRYGYINIVNDIAGVLTIGLLLAGLVSVVVPESFFLDLALGPYQSMFIMLFVSLPLYVCATSMTPFAATLMLKGLSPGAALVFLLAGPATNVATMLVVKNQLGTRALIAYLFGIISIALIFGTITNYWFQNIMPFESALLHHSMHDHQNHWRNLFGIILSLLLCFSLLKRLRRN